MTAPVPPRKRRRLRIAFAAAGIFVVLIAALFAAAHAGKPAAKTEKVHTHAVAAPKPAATPSPLSPGTGGTVTTTIYPQMPGSDYYLAVNSECNWSRRAARELGTDGAAPPIVH
jgi:hypothetical protein